MDSTQCEVCGSQIDKGRNIQPDLLFRVRLL